MIKDIATFNSSSKIPAGIFWIGSLLLLLFIIDIIITSNSNFGQLFSEGSFLVDLLLTLSYSIGIMYVASRLETEGFSNERYARIGKWFLVGMVLFVVIDFPQLLVWSPATFESFLGGTRRSLALGGLCGVIFGLIEARAIERETLAEREAVRAEEAETQRQRLSYLNALLRHEVLNTVHVINSYSTMLLEENHLDEKSRSNLETIQRRADGMSEVIQDMQLLIRATQSAENQKPIHLEEVIEAEIDDLRELNTDVDASVSVPDEVYVAADDVLHRVFANLFSNAIKHNNSERPQIDVTAEIDDDTVRVSIVDNGEGVPEQKLDTLFEPSDTPSATHGLGLYLVRTLVERYGGNVYLSDTGPAGSTFTVELPRATDVRTGPTTSSAAMSLHVPS